MSSVSYCTSLCFIEISFFYYYYFPKENDKHTVTLIRGQPSLTRLQASCQKKKIECSTTEKNISRTPQERKKNVTKLFLFIIQRVLQDPSETATILPLLPFKPQATQYYPGYQSTVPVKLQCFYGVKIRS